MAANTKTTQCVILTKESRRYSEEGLEYIRNILKTNFNVDTENLIIAEGQTYNSPQVMKACIEEDPDVYIVMSLPDSIRFISPSQMQSILAIMDDAEKTGKTSWEAILPELK